VDISSRNYKADEISLKRLSRLVLRAQSGDRDALDQLLQHIQTPLFRYIRYLMKDDFMAADVLQDVFVILCKKIGWVRDASVFRNWAFKIAGREAVRQLKKDKKRAAQFDDDAALDDFPDQSREPEYDAELIEYIPRLVAATPPAARAVLLLHFQHEFTLVEVAGILGIPLGTAKSRLNYGLQKLRNTIQQKDFSP
jgi:RNA polymerase sigma-70 factor, ECF subfamily